MTWSDWIALYGAVTATVLAIVQVREHLMRVKEQSPQVRVTVSNGFLTYQTGDLSDAVLFVDAANIGNRPVTLSSAGFELPDLRTLVMPYPQANVTFPHELAPSKGCKVWLDMRNTAIQLDKEGYRGEIKVVGVYLDETGEVFRSKPFPFNISGWCKKD